MSSSRVGILTVKNLRNVCTSKITQGIDNSDSLTYVQKILAFEHLTYTT